MHPIGLFAVVYGICLILCFVAQLVTIRLLAVRIYEAALFIGPSILSYKWGSVRLTLCCIPLGHFFRVSPEESDLPEISKAEFEQKRHEAMEHYTSLPFGQRFLLSSAGLIALMLLAIILLGPSAAFQEAVNGFVEIPKGLLGISAGLEPALCWRKILENASFMTCLGLLATKLTALNLLPLPGMTGLTLIQLLKEGVMGKSKSLPSTGEKSIGLFELVGLMTTVLLYLSWAKQLFYAFSMDSM